jgi:hypothetical protein
MRSIRGPSTAETQRVTTNTRGDGSVALRYSGRAELAGQVSDRFGKFGEGRGDPQGGAGVGSEVVVAAAQILHEGVPGDHHVRGAIGLKSAHRSQSALELAVIRLDRIVGVPLDVMPRRGQQLVEHAG